GVIDHRMLVQDHNGRMVWITDRFTSTDHKKHMLSLRWQNDQRFCDQSCDATQVEYKFPGQHSYLRYLLADTVSLPHAGGTILIRMHGAADGDTTTGRAAIVYDRAATGATFNFVDSGQDDFTLDQTGKVPASGSTRFRAAYVQDFTQATVDSLAQY